MTIRNLGDELIRQLLVRAAEHGRSMGEEARAILRTALNEHGPPADLSHAIRARFTPPGGVELQIPPSRPHARTTPTRLSRWNNPVTYGNALVENGGEHETT